MYRYTTHSNVWVHSMDYEKEIGETDTFEREILRRIYGPINENGMWRMRHKEIYDLFKKPKISTLVKLKKTAMCRTCAENG